MVSLQSNKVPISGYMPKQKADSHMPWVLLRIYESENERKYLINYW